MYRTPPRTKPKVVIVYRASDLRLAAFFLATLAALFAFGVLASVHTTTLSCRRASTDTDETASCTIDRSGLRPLHVVLPAEMLADLDVTVTSKPLPSAEVSLRLTPFSAEDILEVDTHPFGGGIDLAAASDARARFRVFRSDPSAIAYDASLSRSTPVKALLLGVGVALMAFAFRVVSEQVRELRAIRVVVDHERDALVIGKRTVPVARIRDVIVEEGTLRPTVRRRGEADPRGFRLAIVLVDREHIAACSEWRPGPRSLHERARERLREAIGEHRMTPHEADHPQ